MSGDTAALISKADLRELIVNDNVLPTLQTDFSDDAELPLDSLALVWLIHLLEERYDIKVDQDEEQYSSFTSVETIHAYLAACFPDRVVAEGSTVELSG
jgi:acyl carrier protein